MNQPVNVREYASQDAKQLGTLNAGDSVKVVYQEGDWTQIAYNNTAAWITSSSVQLTGQTTNLAQPAQANLTQAKSGAALKVTTNTMTNLRNAAGIKSLPLMANRVMLPAGPSPPRIMVKPKKRQRNYPKPRLFWIPDMVVQTRVRRLTIIMITKKPIP